MKTRLLHVWEVLTSSYWFVPVLMVAAAVVLAMTMLHVDGRLGTSVRRIGWFYAGGTEGARALLATIAGSVITVAGVVFSITIVTLTQASSQFGPRLLRNFMRDPANQIVLGTFVATFFFCILILRSIQGAGERGWVPHASVSVAVALSLLSILVLIYFIHHVSLSLQAPIVVAAVAHDLEHAIRSHFPAQIGRDMPASPPPTEQDPSLKLADDVRASGCAVTSEQDGYIQAIDQPSVMQLALVRDVVISLNFRPGDYVVAGTPLLYVHPPGRCDRDLHRELRAMFILGRQRTAEQDVEFAIHQLVEIAVRSLSAGVNDPFTAIQCIDRLGSSLRELARNDLLSPYRLDAGGRLRVIVPASTWRGFVDAAWNPVRQYAGDSVPVLIRMLEVIAAIAPQMPGEALRRPLLRQVEMIYRQSRQRVSEPEDLQDIQHRYETARAALLNPQPPSPLQHKGA